MTPSDAPPGVDIRFLGRPSGPAWAEWLADHPAPMTITTSRPYITPRGLLVHTNGANGTGTIQSAINHSMRTPGNTAPHYQADMDGRAAKLLPSNRRGIANYLADGFFLSVETADPGWGPGKPGTEGEFSEAQGETVAQIIAAESELWDFPIEYPTAWNGTGVACHTEPFAYPYWTKYRGKPCPGRRKKEQMREWIMPRAREIRFGQHTPPTPEQPPTQQPQEDDMSIAIHVTSAGQGEQLLVIDGAGATMLGLKTPDDRDQIIGAVAEARAGGVGTANVSAEQFAFLVQVARTGDN